MAMHLEIWRVVPPILVYPTARDGAIYRSSRTKLTTSQIRFRQLDLVLTHLGGIAKSVMTQV